MANNGKVLKFCTSGQVAPNCLRISLNRTLPHLTHSFYIHHNSPTTLTKPCPTNANFRLIMIKVDYN